GAMKTSKKWRKPLFRQPGGCNQWVAAVLWMAGKKPGDFPLIGKNPVISTQAILGIAHTTA
ncbi:MAG: hypothetical protein ACLUGG_03885, partial [Oscillospiraceae bacterium]